MKSMNTLIPLISLIFSLTANAQGLGPDFSCQARDKDAEVFEVVINNIDFSKEITLKKGKKVCNFKISYGSYSERSLAPQMTFNFENVESCFISKKMKPMKKGFLKVSLHKDFNEAHVLILIGQPPIKCMVESFNKKKLRDRIQKAF